MPTPERHTLLHSRKNGDAPTQAELVTARILVVDYDEQWPDLFRGKADAIRAAMGLRALQVEHIGSTSVPGLAAKPVIDILLVLADSADEDSYMAALESAGYVLRIREPDWHEHRMFKGKDPETNLHIFSTGCDEIDRVLTFRDWLRNNPADRDLYASAKMDLARQEWKYVQHYADAKTSVIREIMARAGVD
jgi:GrpB-like predicted nucleotidyltransferase (UPF0157 family)